MTHRPRLPRAALPGIIASATIVASGCFHRGAPAAPPVAPSPQPMSVEQPIVPAVPVVQPASSPTSVGQETTEPYIESWTAVDLDVRLALQKVAEIGKFDLVIPAAIHRTISFQYTHVPVSLALRDILSRSNLRLGTGTRAPLPFDTVTVFYRVPANIDSLSVDAIMKRFGVSRELAELIAKNGRP